MNSVFTNFRVSFLAAVFSIGSISTPTLAVEDVLNTPSVLSKIAKESLLLDVAKAGSRLVAVGARGHILLSDDDGGSWRQVEVPVSVLLTAVHFVDSKYGWAVGHAGVILHSSDGGESWVKQFDGNSANQMIIKQARDKVAEYEAEMESAADDQIESLEYELEEAGFAVEDAELDAEVGASKPLLDVVFSSRKEGFVVGAYGFIFKTTDGGNSWENFGTRIDNPDRFHLNTIARIEGGALLIGGESGVLFRSDDGGESWEVIDSPYDGSFFGITGTGENGVALAFGLRGNLFRSEDAGLTWDEVDSKTESTLMGGGFDGAGQVSIAGNSGSFLLSEDGGRSFSESIRKNRLGNVALVYVTRSRLVVVGETGVSITDPSGQNL